MIVAILQARMSSNRLPGKVLKPILGKPMLQRQIDRLRRSERVDQLVVATSVEPSDDPIETLCDRIGQPCFRGQLENVLDRYYHVAKAWRAEHVVRVTGDCPLIDPSLVDDVIEHHLVYELDYSSNCIEPTFPKGLDTEVFRFQCLEQAWLEASDAYDIEHVTPFLWRQPNRFQQGEFRDEVDRGHFRWTVDYPLDFEFAKCVYESLYPSCPTFTRHDIFELLARCPALARINAGCGLETRSAG